ncbi:MAG: ribonuclease PH [Candidatus Omnitrophica bacterium]|nr:ribonuclease PH [Candidatus Omnitrophota bacterium]
MRADKRKSNDLRKVVIRKGYLKNALGSCLIEMGETKVLCTASLEERVPQFLRGKGKGWLTAEYGMLPASCTERVPREASKGRPSGRTHEIQRLIGRSLRAVVNFDKIGERAFWIDADVIQGDGGTRTAAITGGFVALADAVNKAIKCDRLAASPIMDYVAAVSVGMVNGKPMLDLCYAEDMNAEVDMNVVMTGSGEFIEIQGTAENNPFSKKELDGMLTLAKKGIDELIVIQKKYVRLPS